MKSTIARLTTILIVGICLLTGCTHNNGDIGPFFGKWKLERMTVNTEEVADYEGNIFWSYQSSTISMTRVIDPTSSFITYGNWEVDEDYTVMHISFPDKIHAPLPETYLLRESTIDIIKIKGSEMILQYDSASKGLITYYFVKW